MAYFGTTAASSQANPPRLLVGPFAMQAGGVSSVMTTQGSTAANVNVSGSVQGGQLWYYASTNLTTDFVGAASSNFFTDGYYLGMRPGDLVFGAQLSASAGSTVITFQGAIAQVTTAGAGFSSGSVMTSTFN